MIGLVSDSISFTCSASLQWVNWAFMAFVLVQHGDNVSH